MEATLNGMTAYVQYVETLNGMTAHVHNVATLDGICVVPGTVCDNVLPRWTGACGGAVPSDAATENTATEDYPTALQSGAGQASILCCDELGGALRVASGAQLLAELPPELRHATSKTSMNYQEAYGDYLLCVQRAEHSYGTIFYAYVAYPPPKNLDDVGTPDFQYCGGVDHFALYGDEPLLRTQSLAEAMEDYPVCNYEGGCHKTFKYCLSQLRATVDTHAAARLKVPTPA
jgi:hypothetical protein